MALKSGRVGVRSDQVDAYGRVKHSGGVVEFDTITTKRLNVMDSTGASRYIDANPTNRTTSLYGDVKIGSAETPTDLTVNGDATCENVFVSDELEFSDATGDFGTNAKAKINAALSSGEATQGQVLTADGEGGVSWENGGGGTISLTYVETIPTSNSFTATHNGIASWRGRSNNNYTDSFIIQDTDPTINLYTGNSVTPSVSNSVYSIIFPMQLGHTYKIVKSTSGGYSTATWFESGEYGVISEFRF